MIFTESTRQNLQAPLMADSFCGAYLKADKQTFRPLRNEFNLAQTSLRKLSSHPEASELDALLEENSLNWTALSGSIINVFTHVSRDIELSGWMIAAQTILDPSLSGAKHMVEWLQELVSQHWDTLQPVLPDNKIKSDDENEKIKEINAFKIKAFVQLVGESEESGLLHAPLLMIPLIGDLDFARYQSEEHKGNLADIRSQYNQQALSERAQVVVLIDNLTALKNSFAVIEQKITAICKQSLLPFVSFKFLIKLIDNMLNAIEFISGLKPAAAKQTNIPQDIPVETPPADSIDNVSYVEPTNMISSQSAASSVSFASLAEMQAGNRDQAFHQLREIADYFRRIEPHSPVTYLLEKAIRWGYMPLPELMNELLSNQQDTIDRVFNLTGLDEDGQTVLPEVKKNTNVMSVSKKTPMQEAPKQMETIKSVSIKESSEMAENKSVYPLPDSEDVNDKVIAQSAEQKPKVKNSLSW